jgi:hypothetical protein
MDYPEETIAVGAKGKREARVLRAVGDGFIVYGYADPDTRKPEAKYSILLRRSASETEHLMIVPAGGRELIVKHVVETNPKTRWIYDEKEQKMIKF